MTAVHALAAGEYHALALLDDGRVLTWGQTPNYAGRVGLLA